MFQEGEVTDYISHVTHYSEGHQLLYAFDISSCYEQLTGMVHFMFQIPGKMHIMFYQSEHQALDQASPQERV